MFYFKRLISSKPEGNRALQPYIKRIQTIYRYYDEDGRTPCPNFILRILCYEYWQEGKKISRIGQHDSIAEILSKAISSQTDLSKLLHDMLSKIIIDPHSQFANLMRAFLIYHPQFISGLESIFFSENEPDFLMELESDINILLSMKNYRKELSFDGVLNVNACTALGNLANLIPERHKNTIIELMRDCIEEGNHKINSVVYVAMAKTASFSSGEIYVDVLVFLENKSAKYRTCLISHGSHDYDVEHSQGVCKAFVILLHNTNDPKRREYLAETLLIHIAVAEESVKLIGLVGLGKVARDLSPELREKIISTMLQMEDFLNNFEESEQARKQGTWWPHFVIVYLEVLNQFIKETPPELKLKILFKLLKVIEKTGYTFSLEVQLLVQTFTDTAKQLPLEHQVKLKYAVAKAGFHVLLFKIDDFIPSRFIVSDIRMFLDASENKDSAIRMNALRGLAQLTPHIPKVLLPPVLLAFQKGLSNTSLNDSIFNALVQLIESLPKHLFEIPILHISVNACHYSHPASNYLMKVIEIADETSLNSLFDCILKRFSGMRDDDMIFNDLLAKMIQRFPGKWEKSLVQFVINQIVNKDIFTVVSNSMVSSISTAIPHLSHTDQNYILFCQINPMIDRLKESATKAENFWAQRVLSHLIKIKSEICYARGVDLMVNQHLPPDVSRIVLAY